jgi:hypothetical protein
MDGLDHLHTMINSLINAYNLLGINHNYLLDLSNNPNITEHQATIIRELLQHSDNLINHVDRLTNELEAATS